MSHLDENALNNLRDLEEKTGQELVKSLIKLYVDTTPQILAKMSKLLENKAFEDLSMEAHSLKSSSANIGASIISKLAAEIEKSIAVDNNFNEFELRKTLSSIDDNYICLEVELHKYLK